MRIAFRGQAIAPADSRPAPARDEEHPRGQALLARLLRRQSVSALTGRAAFLSHGLRSRYRLLARANNSLSLLPQGSSAQRARGGARSRRTGQDGAVVPFVRRGLEPRRLASGAVAGVVIGVISILMLGSEGPKALFYIGVALMVVLTAPWILSVLYLRTERGRAARDEHLARSRDEYLARWEHSRGQTRDQAE
jgi:hypothetical protein